MLQYLASLKRQNIVDKTALVRVDFNVENPRHAERVEAVVPTIRFLLARGARVLLASHRGRPRDKRQGISDLRHGVPKELTLRVFAPVLETLLRQKVKFLSTIPPRLPEGRIFLLENLRLWPGEEKNDVRFARSLARLADLYVNDAFASSHRRAASMVVVTKFLPSYAGFCLEREIKTLARVMRKPKRPLLVIIGGGKMRDKMGVIRSLLPRAHRVLLGSASRHKGVPRLPRSSKIILPADWIGERGTPLDLGPETIRRYSAEITKARTIIWNGPMGQFESSRYRRGSEMVARAVARAKAFTVAGGGETTQLLREMGLDKKIGFISTGGGAMLEFLAGKKLPGIEALRNTK